jgi:uncharacterized protein (TIGR00369 family)
VAGRDPLVAGRCQLVALRHNLPTPSSATTTISSSTQFIRCMRSGTAVATARLLHRGRTTIVVETDVKGDSNGKLLARVTQTQAVLSG